MKAIFITMIFLICLQGMLNTKLKAKAQSQSKTQIEINWDTVNWKLDSKSLDEQTLSDNDQQFWKFDGEYGIASNYCDEIQYLMINGTKDAKTSAERYFFFKNYKPQALKITFQFIVFEVFKSYKEDLKVFINDNSVQQIDYKDSFSTCDENPQIQHNYKVKRGTIILPLYSKELAKIKFQVQSLYAWGLRNIQVSICEDCYTEDQYQKEIEKVFYQLAYGCDDIISLDVAIRYMKEYFEYKPNVNFDDIISKLYEVKLLVQQSLSLINERQASEVGMFLESKQSKSEKYLRSKGKTQKFRNILVQIKQAIKLAPTVEMIQKDQAQILTMVTQIEFESDDYEAKNKKIYLDILEKIDEVISLLRDLQVAYDKIEKNESKLKEIKNECS